MLKKILGAILGYIGMFICMFIAFSCFYLVLGTERVFQPGVYQVSITWIVLSLVVIFACSAIGGFIASVIGGGGAAKIMAGIILVLQIVGIVVMVTSATNETRSADVPTMVAMTKAQTPLWALLVQMVVNIAGALVGGGLRKNKLT